MTKYLNKQKNLPTQINKESDIETIRATYLQLSNLSAKLRPPDSKLTPEEYVKILIGTEEQYIETELKNFEENRAIPLQVKSKPIQRVKALYQQKFIIEVKDNCPKAIENLRELTKPFISLFGEQIQRCDEIAYGLRKDLAMLSTHSPIFDGVNYQYDPSYLWGMYKFLFRFLQFTHELSRKKGVSTSEISDDIKEWLQLNANELNINAMLKRIGLIEDVVKKAFEETAKDKDSIVKDFLTLQNGLYEWGENYNLEKDWVTKYAYFFLTQFATNKNLTVDEIAIPLIEYSPKTTYENFEFIYPGWWTSRNIEEYKNEVTKKFKEQLENYVASANWNTELARKLKTSNPKSFEQVKWIVIWNNHNFEFLWQILPYISNFHWIEGIRNVEGKGQQATNAAVDTIRKTFNDFKKFDLPIRPYGRHRKNFYHFLT